jgi:hypothetical protein
MLRFAAVTRAKGTVLVTAYRRTYWAFMLSGGSAVYNLDWSYTVCRESQSRILPCCC